MTALHYRWTCLRPLVPPHHEPCDAAGEGEGSDLAARKHEAATGHPTVTSATPGRKP